MIKKKKSCTFYNLTKKKFVRISASDSFLDTTSSQILLTKNYDSLIGFLTPVGRCQMALIGAA